VIAVGAKGSEIVNITVAEATVRFLIAQRIEIDGTNEPLFPGVLAIFGHGNVTSFGHSLQIHQDELPVWRGQNEQGMGLAAAAFTKVMRRQQILVCTSSIGPGATNMVTAAGVAMSNRLPVLFISGDTFASRLSDPVLQQVEHFGDPSTTVNDSFRPVVRFWDRIVNPAQLMSVMPQAVNTMLDPGQCGPAFIGLPQDIAAMAYDFPAEFFAVRVHRINRPRPDSFQLAAVVERITKSARPVIIAGGGIHYSRAEQELAEFAQRHAIPVVETVAGKSCLLSENPMLVGPIGVTGAQAPNELVAQADLVVAIGTRLQDFTTGSWTLFDAHAEIVGINSASFDANKHFSMPLVCDAREALVELSAGLDQYRTPASWQAEAARLRVDQHSFVESRTALDGDWPPSYAQIVGRVHHQATKEDYVLTAAGGLPGELNINWESKAIASFDCEYGFSCMGYEIAGAWGAAMARREGEVFALVGDGSYLMMNSEIYSSIVSGHKFILVVCDNEGYAVIDRLQVNQGGVSFNNMLRDVRGPGKDVRVDFVAHAGALGAATFTANSVQELDRALALARQADRTSVIVLGVRASDWTEGGAFWEVGVPEVSDRGQVREARERLEAGLQGRRRGV
jgi:3D-(3,5/4)-trihydroxycyclohexane-1,2-dione acylhydrolase (decyclizing)